MFSNGQQTPKAMDPDLRAVVQREPRQDRHIALIARENDGSPAVVATPGSQLTDPCAEGDAGRRCDGGCEFMLTVAEIGMAHHLGLTRGPVRPDKIIKTLREAGADMKTPYEKTSRGGLAVPVVAC